MLLTWFLSLCLLTSSRRRPLCTCKILPIINGRTFKHAFRFLCVWPGDLSTCHVWRATVAADVYTRNRFPESMWSRFGGPGQKALQTMNEFTLFVDFCLIPLSRTCSFDIPAKNLQRRIYIHYHEAFHLCQVCRLFDRALVNNRPLRQSLPTI